MCESTKRGGCKFHCGCNYKKDAITLEKVRKKYQKIGKVIEDLVHVLLFIILTFPWANQTYYKSQTMSLNYSQDKSVLTQRLFNLPITVLFEMEF